MEASIPKETPRCFSCNRCEKHYTSASNLRRHQQTCLGCEVCDIQFPSKNALDQHIMREIEIEWKNAKGK